MPTIMSFILSAFIATPAWAALDPAQVLTSEYQGLVDHIKSIEPDGELAGLMYFKTYEGYELLWDKDLGESDHEVIRIYSRHDDGTDFDVSYYRSNQILRGRWILRRFVGPGQRGWRNDTVDLVTGEYLGRQGTEVPRLTDQDRAIMEALGIELLK